MMKRAWLASLMVLAGCSSSSSSGTPSTNTEDSGTSGTGTATLHITSPTANATITLDTGNTMPISFTTTSFTLMAPNTCKGKTNCGHVHVLIDDDACNDSAGGLPYNVAANASPATANLSFCPSADGDHQITLELHNDDHSPYLVDGKVVAQTIMISTTGP
ncbi:MAG: hypothetical protein ABI551_18150 [Polyangiaceae bacterium]